MKFERNIAMRYIRKIMWNYYTKGDVCATI